MVETGNVSCSDDPRAPSIVISSMDSTRPTTVEPINHSKSITANDHYESTVRAVKLHKLTNESWGFHLSRSKWDPYPWISGIDKDSPAEAAKLKVGDCILEVNQQDVLGLRIAEIANIVRIKADVVSMLLWNSGNCITNCNPESLCCGPMPQNLERLSASMSTILAAMECPICFDTIPPPVIQCQNGHLVCAKCRTRSERCPICREKYSPGRSLIAEQIYNSLTDAFQLPNNERLREKLFGGKFIRASDLKYINVQSLQHRSHTQKFLAKFFSKSSSMENLNTIRAPSIAIQDNLKTTKSQSTTELSAFHNLTQNGVQPSPISTHHSISPIKVGNLRHPTSLTSSCGNLVTCRHPSSINQSTESLTTSLQEQLIVPPPPLMKQFKCPVDSKTCARLMCSGNELRTHVMVDHRSPIISFGIDSANVELPPRAPMDQSFLLLKSDDGQCFWLRLKSTADALFCSAIHESNDRLAAQQYVLVASIVNVNGERIGGAGDAKELINRSSVYSLSEYSWQQLCEERLGIQHQWDMLNATFDTDHLLLTVSINRAH